MTTSDEHASTGFSFSGYLLVALALSIGWGIRGNFGHEYGAMMPGSLAALAVALASGREDWLRRAPWFGFLGAFGWSFGGSQSYMQVIGYTHSGDSVSVLYGFACLSLMGLLWACFGGAFTAFAAVLDRKRLNSLASAAIVVILVWLLQDFLVSLRQPPRGNLRHEDPLYWFDTDWLGATTALVGIVLFCLIRRRVDFGSSMVIHMSLGWMAGFLGLVVLLGFRMTPPRGDNWSGCLGMFVGLLVFLIRHRLTVVTWVTIVTGVLGGAAFALATLIKLAGMKSGLSANWHSVLEQTYGLLNGLALAIPMSVVAQREPVASEPSDEPEPSRWPVLFALWFTLCAVVYVNLIKNVDRWVQAKAITTQMGILPAWGWYTLFFGLISVIVIVLGRRHQQKRLAFVPESATGRTQAIFLVLLWTLIIGNFERALVGFVPARLVTEGIVTLNALICTLIAALLDRHVSAPSLETAKRFRSGYVAWTLALVVIFGGLNIAADWQITRGLYGDERAGHASLHIRFGPRSTVKPGPEKGAAHP